MGRAFVQAFASARAVFEEAGNILGYDLSAVCFNGPADRLSATDVQQPAIFVASLAIWAAVCERKPELAAVNAMGGLSLGEYMALSASGSISLPDGVRLVQQRGRLMQSASEAKAGSMATFIGLDRKAVDELVVRAKQDQILVVANHLAQDLVVVSGEKAAVDRACILAEDASARVNRLEVAGAFHSPLMAPAAEAMGRVLADIDILKPQIPVVSNVTGDYHGSPEEIRRLLQQQVVRPVEWAKAIGRLMNDGCRRMIAVGPGASQRAIIRRIDRTLDVLVVDSPADIEKL